MRIAYITPYQGPTLRERRPIVRNLALAANLKIELVAELLASSRHEVEILSQGDVDRQQFRFYPGFREPKSFSPSINVTYVSNLPVKYIRSFWPAWRMLQLFKAKHRAAPYDLVIVYNLDLPQMLCARYAISTLGLPVVLEHEDDALVDVGGRVQLGWKSRAFIRLAESIFGSVSGALGPSPHLLSRVPSGIPKFLLRGVVSDEVMRSASNPFRKNWVAFSGTFFRTKGLEPLLQAWRMLDLPDWQLHLAGDGEKMAVLRKMAQDSNNIVFHGVLDRRENARLLSTARIGINPHDLSQTPGNVFAFKIIEYLAAGLHVITTPMGPLEAELEAGISYIADNSAETVATAIRSVIEKERYRRTATEAAHNMYGQRAVASSLNRLLDQIRPSLVRRTA